MCGIVCHFHPTKNVNTRTLLDHYLTQRHRGYDGFGFSYMDDEGKLVTKRYQYEAEAFYDLSHVESRMILVHHRFPTSTKNEARFNQPIERTSKKAQFALAHNGVIQNVHSLRREEFKDYELRTKGDSEHIFNDSEILLHSLTDVLERKRKAILSAGTIAFVMIKANEDGKITRVYFGRNTNPLYYLIMQDGTQALSSTFDGARETDMIDPDHLYQFPVYGKDAYKFTKKKLEFPTRIHYSSPASTPATRAVTPVTGDYKRSDIVTKNDMSGDWEKDEDGQFWLPKSKEPTKILLSEKIAAQNDYMEALKIAKDLLHDLSVMGIDGISKQERYDALREIDDTISLLNEAVQAAYGRETTKSEELRTSLLCTRLDYLPVNDPLPQSMSIVERVTSMFTGHGGDMY